MGKSVLFFRVAFLPRLQLTEIKTKNALCSRREIYRAYSEPESAIDLDQCGLMLEMP